MPTDGFNKSEYREKYRQYYYNLSKIDNDFKEMYDDAKKKYKLEKRDASVDGKRATKKVTIDGLKAKMKNLIHNQMNSTVTSKAGLSLSGSISRVSPQPKRSSSKAR